MSSTPSPLPEFGSHLRGWVFASVWLVYLGYPLQAAWHSPSTGSRVLAVTALTVFAATYLVAFARVRRLRRRGQRVPRAWYYAALMLVALALAAPASGQAVLSGVIYVAVLCVMALPGRQALAAVAGLTFGSAVLPYLVPGWTGDASIPFQTLISCLAAWGVVQIISRNVELAHAREQIARLAVDDERARMARDLHDILGHSLTVITVKAELAGRLAEAEGARCATAEIADVERLAREALADVRATVGGVRRVSLAGELVNARIALEASGITPDLPQAVDDVPAERRELFAWVVREGVTNVVRHSGAHRCAVRLGRDWVEVADDGRGPVAEGVGNGLAGLRERVVAEVGVMSAGAAPGGGFRLHVQAPA